MPLARIPTTLTPALRAPAGTKVKLAQAEEGGGGGGGGGPRSRRRQAFVKGESPKPTGMPKKQSAIDSEAVAALEKANEKLEAAKVRSCGA